MRSHILPITPRLWLMNSRLVLELGAQPGDQIQHLALDGGVEAGGGLVEDQQRGSLASAIAITTRCCMPPESWCG